MIKLRLMLLAALAAIFLVVSCQQPDLSAYAKKSDSANATGICLQCHTTDSTYNLANGALVAQTAYKLSAHGAGALRELSGSSWVFGSAVIENAAGCSKCHTSQGFQQWAVYGPAPIPITATTKPSDIANTSIVVNQGSTTVQDFVSCFACHDPHSKFDFGLRLDKNVSLPSGMPGVGATASTVSTQIFAGGEGNLCANCHQDRTTPNALNAFLAPTATNAGIVKLTNRLLHHSVQADFIMGLDNPGYSTSVPNGYMVGGAAPSFTNAPPVHYTGTVAPSQVCVTCHVNHGASASDHTMFLTSATQVDNVAVCQTCHGGSATSFNGYGNSANLLGTIATARATLLTFFGNPIYFYASAAAAASLQTATGYAAIGAPSTASTDTSYGIAPGAYFGADPLGDNSTWQSSALVYMTPSEAQAYFIFLLIQEDRSNGIHNPKYAADLLFDAITLINNDPVITATAGWVGLANPWTSRPF